MFVLHATLIMAVGVHVTEPSCLTLTRRSLFLIFTKIFNFDSVKYFPTHSIHPIDSSYRYLRHCKEMYLVKS